jgi:hypothetical protein
MTPGQEHVPKPEGLGLLLQIIDNSRVILPSRISAPYLGFEDGIGAGDAVWSDRHERNA